MARHYVDKLIDDNKSLNLASAPRSTEIALSHGHATTTEADKNEGTMVSNTEVNLAGGQHERSVDDTTTIGNVAGLNEMEALNAIRREVLMSTNAQ